jgi:hypothetical protein
MTRESILWIALAVLLPGCPGDKPAGPAQPVEQAVEEAPPSDDPLATDNSLCFGDRRKVSLESKVAVGDKTATTVGYRLDLPTAAEDQLVLGILANIENSTPATLANLDGFVEAFQDAGADAILVDGDVGDSRVDLEANLGRLARSGIPVLAMVGNREGRVDFERAVDAVRAEHPAVFNLNHIRLVNTPVADLVTLPGYNDRNFVHKSDGCVYDSNELQFLTGVLADADSPVVLVAHSSHKMEGEDAVDHAIDTGNIGNPDLREWVQENKVHFGIYANAQEAGGRGTDLSGSRVIKPGTAVGELFVNPGPAMSDPWTMNDRSESRGMGMVATFAANKLSYQVIRSEQAAAAE